MDIDFKMLLFTLLTFVSPGILAQFDDSDLEDDNWSDLTDFDLDLAPRRVPRQVKAMLTKESKPHIQELSIKTTIISRYAFTAVSCTLLNRHTAAAEGVFHFQVPVAAYISNFTMIIGGRVYPSDIRPKEKKVKKEKGGEGKPQNKGEGDQSSEAEMELFRMAASIPGRNRAVFLLTYEELLQRRLGRYEHVTSLRPLQLVSRLSVDVTVVEHSSITHLEVLPLRNGKGSAAVAKGASANAKTQVNAAPVTTVIKQNKNVCKITFNPNIVQQAQITTSGILGDFVVRYDVEREMGIGDIQVLNGHFVHYFAPKDLPAVPKNVVFVIDNSASMLGTKMRQTKEALFTILRDLRPEDHFNFVSFSNRIKVWKPKSLVPVTPINVRDAKKFIYMLAPTGGTDINGAMQTGSSLLSDYLSSSSEAGRNSVSLIIFLTDGRPTVGVQESPLILGNARAAVGESICVFTIGLGNDVDFRLLERMALENCGMTRRIPEDADASAMLKGFYDEVGTPLLSDIRINYPEDSVQYVTQHLFSNYFNGSELVVAGKLTNQSAESLRVQVTASSSDKSIILETDVPLRQREVETERHVKAAAEAGVKPGSGAAAAAELTSVGSLAKDFVERVWGFLSVKEGLRNRLTSQTSTERESHTQHAANLSVAYHFLSPLTSLVVEKPQVLPDGTMAGPDPTPTPGPTPDTDKVSSTNELSEDSEVATPQSLHRNENQPGRETTGVAKTTGQVQRKAVKKSITLSRTSADGDPHFVVEFPLSKLAVCFNINGEPGHVLRLVSDHRHSGVTVNGALIGAPAPAGSHKQQRTYFSTITIVVKQPSHAYIEITPKKVILDGRDRMILPCDTTVSVESGGLAVAIVGKANVTVTVGGTISFVILVHQYKNPAPYQRDHLGFYISQSKGLSPSCHGLLGQFLFEDVRLGELPVNATSPGDKVSTVLKVKGRSVPVVQKTRRIYSGTQSVDCWFARNNAAKLIDGEYENYVVSHLFDSGDWPHGETEPEFMSQSLRIMDMDLDYSPTALPSSPPQPCHTIICKTHLFNPSKTIWPPPPPAP